MRALGVLIVQVVISLLVVGAVLPMVLFSVPAARDGRVALPLTAAALLGMVFLLRLAWSRPRT